MQPLELDESTRSERQQAQDLVAYNRRSPSSKFDMLTGQVPGTDLILGMSRRLFAACRSLAAEQAQILLDVQADLPDLVRPLSSEVVDEDGVEDVLRQRRAVFAEREADARDRLRMTTRQAYETGRSSTWQQLLDVDPQLIAATSPGLLESATPDTYIAIQAIPATPGVR